LTGCHDPVLHRGVQLLFDGTGKRVNFIEEENVAFTERQQPFGHVRRGLDRRGNCLHQTAAHLGGDDPGQSRFPLTRG
jgi:hypothetical protein